MLSRIFQYVANRNDFTNPWLSTQTAFEPVKANPNVNKIRSFLNLDKNNLNSDYFVTSVVSVLIANHTIAHTLSLELDVQPEIWKKIQTERFKCESSGWTLSNSKSGPASTKYLVNTWPVSLQGTLTKINEATARLQMGSKFEDISAVFINSKTLQVEWPDWFKLNGVLITEDTEAWAGSNTQISFFAPPSNYPIKSVVSKLTHESAFLEMLEQRGYLAYYSGADANDSEKLAIGIYCLYLDTLEKIQN